MKDYSILNGGQGGAAKDEEVAAVVAAPVVDGTCVPGT